MKKSRQLRGAGWLLFTILIYIPAVIFYFGWIAKDRYVSRTKFIVSRGKDTNESRGALSGMLGADQTRQDAYNSIAYIYSMDVMDYLKDEGFDLRDHYSKADLDWFYRLDPGASKEDLLHYMEDRINAHFDDVEGIIELQVESFEPEYSLRLATAILDQVEEYLNLTNRSIAEERMKFILSELEANEKKLESARACLIDFQNENLVINPEEDTQARIALINDLKKQKVKLKAKMLDLKNRSPRSPAIQEYESEIEGLAQEIASESTALTGEDPGQMNQLNAEFTKLNEALNFARNRYEQSLTVSEEIRIQTLQDHRFLTVIERPFLPEEAEYPKRIYMSISMIVLGIVVIQLLSLLMRTVLEHRN